MGFAHAGTSHLGTATGLLGRTRSHTGGSNAHRTGAAGSPRLSPSPLPSAGARQCSPKRRGSPRAAGNRAGRARSHLFHFAFQVHVAVRPDTELRVQNEAGDGSWPVTRHSVRGGRGAGGTPRRKCRCRPSHSAAALKLPLPCDSGCSRTKAVWQPIPARPPGLALSANRRPALLARPGPAGPRPRGGAGRVEGVCWRGRASRGGVELNKPGNRRNH